MKIKKDISGIDKFIESIPNIVVDHIYERGLQAVERQKEKHTYQNRTFNLDNAGGISVFYNGRERLRYIGVTNPETATQAREATDRVLDSMNKSGTGIIFADGMFYASYVDSKGYDVVDTAYDYLKKNLCEEK